MLVIRGSIWITHGSFELLFGIPSLSYAHACIHFFLCFFLTIRSFLNTLVDRHVEIPGHFFAFTFDDECRWCCIAFSISANSAHRF